jgi:hypothetical protein
MTSDRRDPLVTLQGVVEAPVDAVAAVLLDVRPGGTSPLLPDGHRTPVDTADGTVAVLVSPAGGGGITVTAYLAARMVSVQGEWWYRSETVLTAHERGCLVTQRVFNVASRLRWAVRFVARKPLAGSAAGFADLLRALGERLAN